jgi:hypothetical protein
MFTRLVAASVALLLAPSIHAGPDATARFLLNEPVTMMDLGVERLQRSLDALDDPDVKNFVRSAQYQWGGNQFAIALWRVSDGERDTPEEAVAQCKRAIRAIRVHFLVDPDSGKPLRHGDPWEALFGHAGYRNPKEPAQLYDDIAKMVHIVVSTNLTKRHPPAPVVCSAELLGSAVAVSK